MNEDGTIQEGSCDINGRICSNSKGSIINNIFTIQKLLPETIIIASEKWYYQPDNIASFVITSLSMIIYVELVRFLASRGFLSSISARKIMHVGCGMVFILFWPLFSSSTEVENINRLVAFIPLTMTLKFAAIGLGIIKVYDEKFDYQQ